MTDPLKALLVDSEGIYLVQAGPGEPVSWHGSEEDAREIAEREALALGKKAYVFRAMAVAEPVEEPVRWTSLVEEPDE